LWQEPEGVSGPFYATVELPGSFEVKSEPCDIHEQARITAYREMLHTLRVWAPILVIFLALMIAVCKLRVRWPAIAILLYSFLIVVVFMPLLFLIAVLLGKSGGIEFDEVPGIFLKLYTEVWFLWVFCGFLILCEIILLIMPIRIVKERPKPQRGIWITTIAAAALFVILILGIVLSISAAIWGDDIPDISGWILLFFVIFNWLFWTCLFRYFAHNHDAKSYVRRLMKWLLRGSILEILVSIPSHIIVRHKDVCCAHGLTAAGLATGFAIMLISFGPGVYFLYAERIRSKTVKSSKNNGVET